MPRPRILFVSLGGTITMTPAAEGGSRPTLRAEDLMQAVPALSDVVEISAASPLQLPGASLSLADLLQVAQLVETHLADDTDGVALAQGTDTIEETAFALDRLVRSDKPVVVTGAMRGPAMPGADGPANLLAAVGTAAGGSRARHACGPQRRDSRGALRAEGSHVAALRFPVTALRPAGVGCRRASAPARSNQQGAGLSAAAPARYSRRCLAAHCPRG